MQGFTRTVYDDGYKYTMVYPPGWKQGDSRQPEVYREPCVPGPSRTRVAERYALHPWPYPAVDLPDRQPRSTATRSHHLAGARGGTGPATPEGVQRAQTIVWSHPLKVYLAQLWMPAYKLGAPVNASARFSERSFLRGLVRPPRTRTLYLVQRIVDWDLRHGFAILNEVLRDAQITAALVDQEKLADLSLPDTAYCSLDEDDAVFIDDCRLSAPSDVTRFLQMYPLRTVIKAAKLFLNIPDEHEVCARMTFDDVNHLCPVRNAGLFDLIALPGYGAPTDELSLLVVVVAPWTIQFDDLEEFTRIGVPDCDLDLIPNARTAPPIPVHVLWAVIWDMCLKHNCRFFILTSYDAWVFGTLSTDMHRAKVTTHLRAPVFPRDMAVSAQDVAQPCFPVPNVFECLLLWLLAAADGDHIWWPLPPNMPVPVVGP